MRRRRLSSVGLLPALVLASACAVTAADEADCERAPQELVDVLQAEVGGGQLRNAAIHHEPSNDLVFITAELHEPDDPEDLEGDLLTWAAPASAPRHFVAVDTYARDRSNWPEADFDVHTTGAIHSRACAALWAGDPGPPG